MARYTDVDALLNELPDDLPYKASVKRVLMQAPAADVAPKSEVERLEHLRAELSKEIETLKDNNEHLAVLLAEAKREVAMEIFEEINYILFDYEGAIQKEYRNAFEERFAELKKKYTEEKL